MSYHGVEIYFACISKIVSRFFLFLSCFFLFFPVFRIYTNRIYGHRDMIGNFPVAISIGVLVDGSAIQFAFIAANLMDVDEMILEDFNGSDSIEKVSGNIF